MLASLAPPSSGGCRTFSVAAWNICCGWGNGLISPAKGLAKMGVGCAILFEMKITNERYARTTLGYKVLVTKAPKKYQVGITLLWQPEQKAFEIEATKIVTPNLITFQLVTGDKRYYVIGIYIPPNGTEGGTTFGQHGGHAQPIATLLSWATSTSMLETPATTGKRILPTCWLKSTSLTRLPNSRFGGAVSKRHGLTGPGVRSVEGAGYTLSQITSWPGRGVLGGFGRLASDLHQSTIPIIARLLRICGKGKVGPSRPINATTNAS